jgi:hypothetical protein
VGGGGERPRLSASIARAHSHADGRRKQGEGIILLLLLRVFSPLSFSFFFLCDELAAGFGVVGGNSPKRCAFIYERGTRRFVWVRGVHDACGRGRW